MSAIFGETLIFSQDDGPDVELVTFGDEFYARYETRDGRTVVYDSDLGRYCYATLAGGRLASTGIGLSKPPPHGVARHVKESEAVRNAKFRERHLALRPPEPDPAPHIMRTLGRDSGLLAGRRVSEGEVRGLTILVEFTDLETRVTREDVDALLNGEDYHANGNHCSVREYYQRVSAGRLSYRNTVVGPVRLAHGRSHYKTTLLVEEALNRAVDELGVDLSEYDSRNEGIVDAVNVMYAGRTLYEGQLWPHNATLDLRIDGLRTHFYMLTSLGRRRIDLSIGTFCHESGHLLCRFPDLYDYGTRDGDGEKSQGIGRYCLMGSGNHLNRGRTPSPICAYLRDLVGWPENEVLLNQAGAYQVRHGDYDTVYKFQTDKPNEYFLVENRSRLGLDAHLPSAGLAVYHCDTLGSNEWQGGTRDRHYQCGLLQADGHLDLENNRNPGDAGDLFVATSGEALAHDSTPASTEWDGRDSGLVLSDIGAPGEIIGLRAGAVPATRSATAETSPDLLIPDDDPAGATSILPIGVPGTVESVQVDVDITHTWIGDLRVSLSSPDGHEVVLHDRAGQSRDDLRERYDAARVPGLAELTGRTASGDWTLHVRDLARRDTGRLNHWRIELALEARERVARVEREPGLAIPDNDRAGVEDAVSIAESGQLRGLAVELAIRHSYVGDLVVELIAPSGERAPLHDRAGGARRDLVQTLELVSTPALEGLVGEPIQGQWRLRVRDLARYDTGTLERWSLSLSY